MNRAPSLSVAGAAAAAEEDEAGAAAAAAAASSSPNNSAGSFPTDFSSAQGQGAPGGGADRACSRASDDDDGGSARKKLRLSKEQSAFLEESFKEHATLNPVSNRSRRNHQVLVPRPISILTFVGACVPWQAEAEAGAGEAAQPPAAPGGGVVPEPQSPVRARLHPHVKNSLD